MRDTGRRATNHNGHFRSALIFGGAGFIGANWAAHLLRRTQARVHVFDNLSRPGVRHNLEWLQKLDGASGRLRITVGDIRNGAMVERAVRTATEVYQFAAQVAVTTSVADPRLDFDVNLGGTFNVLEAVRAADRHPFLLFTSTNKVYGHLGTRRAAPDGDRYLWKDGEAVDESEPLDFHSPYGCSKGAADQYVLDYARTYSIPAVVLRMSCVAGPHQFGTEDQGWVAHFLYSALAGRPVAIYGDGRQVRDVLAVEDLLRAFEAVRQALPVTRGQAYNVGGGPQNAVSLLELIDQIEKLTGRHMDYFFDQRRIGDQLLYITDFSKLQRDAGWQPTTGLRQVLEGMLAWSSRHRHLLPPTAAEHQSRSAFAPRVAA